jgi:hypothetical protein
MCCMPRKQRTIMHFDKITIRWHNYIYESNIVNRKFMEISCDQHLPWRSRRQYCLRLKSAYSHDSSLWTKENMLGSNNSCEYIAQWGRVVLKSLRDLVRILLASRFSQRNQQRCGLRIISFITMDWLLNFSSIPSFVGRRVKTFFPSQVAMTITGSAVHCDHSRYNNRALTASLHVTRESYGLITASVITQRFECMRVSDSRSISHSPWIALRLCSGVVITHTRNAVVSHIPLLGGVEHCGY